MDKTSEVWKTSDVCHPIPLEVVRDDDRRISPQIPPPPGSAGHRPRAGPVGVTGCFSPPHHRPGELSQAGASGGGGKSRGCHGGAPDGGICSMAGGAGRCSRYSPRKDHRVCDVVLWIHPCQARSCRTVGDGKGAGRVETGRGDRHIPRGGGLVGGKYAAPDGSGMAQLPRPGAGATYGLWRHAWGAGGCAAPKETPPADERGETASCCQSAAWQTPQAVPGGVFTAGHGGSEGADPRRRAGAGTACR